MLAGAAGRLPRLDHGGVLFGLVYAGLSLTPSLLPRPVAQQGIITGLSFAVGYLLGAAGWFLVKLVVKWRPSPSAQRVGWWSVVVAWLLGAVALAILTVTWQNDVRRHVGDDVISTENWLVLLAAAVTTAAACMSIGSTIRSVYRWARFRLEDRFETATNDTWWRHRYTARALALGSVTAGVIVASVLVTAIGLATVDYTYARKYAQPPADLRAPSSDFRSAGSGSTLAWGDLGRDGGHILAEGPHAADITAVTGLPAVEPIRVYVGLRSAPSVEQRAQAAIRELVRLHAERRAVLVVAGTTGTGWLDPAAIDSLEYLHAGNTALVTMQYADTPSWRSSLFAPEVPVEAASALFDAVHDWWSTLPEDDRPQLVVYGLSLGASAMQGAFFDVDDLLTRTQGAVFAGTPGNTPLWQDITAARDPGTTVVEPVFRGGEHVRFFSQPDEFIHVDGTWDRPRVVFLQHGSDPVTWGSLSMFYQEPEWLKAGQRSEQVSPYVRWIPIVSGLQAVVDFNLGQAVPPDAGHKYGNVTLDAWVAVTGTAPGMTDDAVASVRGVIAAYDVVLPVDE